MIGLRPYKWCVSTPSYSAPAKPWDGEDTSVSPATDFFTPQTRASAQGMNYVLKQITQDTNNLWSDVSAATAHNWKGLSVPDGHGTGLSMGGVAWDPYFKRWLCTYSDSGAGANGHLYKSTDGAKSWSKVNTTDFYGAVAFSDISWCPFLAVDSTTGKAVVIDPGATTVASGLVYDPATDTYAGIAWATFFATATRVQALLTWFASKFVFMKNGGLRTSTNGTSWTTQTFSSTFTPQGPSNGLAPWVAGGGRMLVFGTDSAYDGISDPPISFMSSTDGVTWTHGAVPSGVGEVVLGCAYSLLGTEDTYMVLVGTGATSTCKVLVSTDAGTTWTQQATIDNARGLGSIGSLWATAKRETDANANNMNRILYSMDKGVTWNTSLGGDLNPDTTNDRICDVNLMSNGNQFVAYNRYAINGSFITGVA